MLRVEVACLLCRGSLNSAVTRPYGPSHCKFYKPACSYHCDALTIF